MGYECIFFRKYEELVKINHTKEELIVSDIGIIKQRLEEFGIDCTAINYLKGLEKYFGRKIWKSTINEIVNILVAWSRLLKSAEKKNCLEELLMAFMIWQEILPK